MIIFTVKKNIGLIPFSTGTICTRLILTSKDGPCTERMTIIIMVVGNSGIQMKWKELTKTFMMI